MLAPFAQQAGNPMGRKPTPKKLASCQNDCHFLDPGAALRRLLKGVLLPVSFNTRREPRVTQAVRGSPPIHHEVRPCCEHRKCLFRISNNTQHTLSKLSCTIKQELDCKTESFMGEPVANQNPEIRLRLSLPKRERRSPS